MVCGLHSKITTQGNAEPCRLGHPKNSVVQRREFEYTTRNINVAKILSEARVTRNELDQLKEALYNVDWKDPIFENTEHFPVVALQAYYQNEIGTEEFSNVLIYYSIRKHHPMSEIQTIALFDDKNQPIHSTIKWIKDEFTGRSKRIFYQLYDDKLKHQDESAANLFVDRLAKQSKISQTIFAVPKKSTYKSIYQAIIRNGNYLFSKGRGEYEGMRLIPSFEMMQEATSAIFGVNAVRYQPSIGVSTTGEIEQNGIENSRDVGLAFPGYHTPNKADGYTTDLLYDFTFHDFYHCLVASAIPILDKRKFIYLAKIAKSTLNFQPLTTKTGFYGSQVKEAAYQALIDMEHGRYEHTLRPASGDSLKAEKSIFSEVYINDLPRAIGNKFGVFVDSFQNFELSTVNAVSASRFITKFVEQIFKAPFFQPEKPAICQNLKLQSQESDNPCNSRMRDWGFTYYDLRVGDNTAASVSIPCQTMLLC